MALNLRNGSRPSEEEQEAATTNATTNTTKTTSTKPTTSAETTTDEASPEGDAPRRRRGTRGGRSSATKTAAAAATATRDAPADDASDEEAPPAPAPRRATSRRRESDEGEETPPARAPRRRAPAAKATEDEAEKPRQAAPRRRTRATAKSDEADAVEADGGLLEALKEQNETLTRLVALQEQTIARLSEAGAGNGGGRGRAAGPAGAPRVGIFVDSANIELARDRSRGGASLDWGLIMKRLTEGRRLVRAIAYSPVHDDPGVSPETQRFVEPFLGKGFKIVTKPLKRFADGSIKANVDIELSLDLITMADRLDIAVLISGDGDFQPLVEAVQARGVRVEVAGLGTSVAGSLKKAADQYVELDFAQKNSRKK